MWSWAVSVVAKNHSRAFMWSTWMAIARLKDWAHQIGAECFVIKFDKYPNSNYSVTSKKINMVLPFMPLYFLSSERRRSFRCAAQLSARLGGCFHVV